jgi:P27 family predicted phage terminase small subunit
MPAGRPPKPVERLAATQRDANHKADGREIARIEVKPDRTVPALPEIIKGRGEVEWRNIWTAGFWLKRDQDYMWVEMIAQAYTDIEAFRERVELDGPIARGYAGQVTAHPLIAEIRKCEATIQKCLSVLGFSPTDRARLAITEMKARSALQEMIDAQS